MRCPSAAVCGGQLWAIDGVDRTRSEGLRSLSRVSYAVLVDLIDELFP
jgi:hypothetical protein